jgi:hypothetical protein
MPPGPKFKKRGGAREHSQKMVQKFWGHKPQNFKNIENGFKLCVRFHQRCLAAVEIGKSLFSVISENLKRCFLKYSCHTT